MACVDVHERILSDGYPECHEAVVRLRKPEVPNGNALERHFTNHSRQLSVALAKSTERAWRALELSRAGDGLWDRGKRLLCGGNVKAFRKQAKVFLDCRRAAVAEGPAVPARLSA